MQAKFNNTSNLYHSHCNSFLRHKIKYNIWKFKLICMAVVFWWLDMKKKRQIFQSKAKLPAYSIANASCLCKVVKQSAWIKQIAITENDKEARIVKHIINHYELMQNDYLVNFQVLQNNFSTFSFSCWFFFLLRLFFWDHLISL